MSCTTSQRGSRGKRGAHRHQRARPGEAEHVARLEDLGRQFGRRTPERRAQRVVVLLRRVHHDAMTQSERGAHPHPEVEVDLAVGVDLDPHEPRRQRAVDQRATLKRLSPSDAAMSLLLSLEVVAPGDGRREHERRRPGALLQCHETAS